MVASSSRTQFVGFLGAFLLLSVPVVVAAAGGGSVNNKLPTVESFSVGLATDNVGATGVFSGVVKDRNKEGDVAAIQLSRVSGPAVVSDLTRTLTAADVAAASEPASFDAGGWKVWNPSPDNGELSFKVQLPYPTTAGSYVFRLSVKDEGAYQNGPAADLTVTLLDKILVAADPVGADGAAQAGANWGAWTTDPGASSVPALNYLKVTNTGVTAAQAFVLDFTSVTFGGAAASSTIPIDGNMEFAYWEDTTPGATAPSEGTFTFAPVSAFGSATISFTGTSNVVYVTYRLASIPDPLADQAYTAAYTVDAQ